MQEIFACEIRNLVNFPFVESEFPVLESGIQLKESGIPLRIGIQNPSSTKKDWNTVPEIRNPRRGIPLHGVMDSLTCMGR